MKPHDQTEVHQTADSGSQAEVEMQIAAS